MVKKKEATKEQLSGYIHKLNEYIQYMVGYRDEVAESMVKAAGEGTQPPNGPKKPPKFP